MSDHLHLPATKYYLFTGTVPQSHCPDSQLHVSSLFIRNQLSTALVLSSVPLLFLAPLLFLLLPSLLLFSLPLQLLQLQPLQASPFKSRLTQMFARVKGHLRNTHTHRLTKVLSYTLQNLFLVGISQHLQCFHAVSIKV